MIKNDEQATKGYQLYRRGKGINEPMKVAKKPTNKQKERKGPLFLQGNFEGAILAHLRFFK